jgi:hypothetical protein
MLILSVVIRCAPLYSFPLTFLYSHSSYHQVKVAFRMTVCQSVSLGVGPHLGLMTIYLLLFDSYGLVFVGVLSDERTSLSPVYDAGPGQRSFLGSESFGTRDHILQAQI